MHNLRPIALMILSMACFTIGDSAIKLAARSIPAGEVLAAIGLFGAAAFAAMTRAQGHRVLAPDLFHRAVLARNLFEVIGTLCMVTALSLVALSTTSAILQATPLAVTLGAAVLLREPVGWRRWLATIVGFGGVLLIVRPGAAGFELASLWAVAALGALAMRDLLTRLAPATTPTLRLATYGMASLFPAGLISMALFGQPPVTMGLATSVQVALAVGFGVAGYWALTAAMRMGEVSVVAPFRYARILFAIAAGILVFGERPDRWVLIGAAITVAAGLYIFLREGRLKKAG